MTAENQRNVDNDEIAKFSQIADKWWDKNGEFKPLHDINPLRLNYIDRLAPLAGKRVLDVGCGGGRAITRILARTRREVAGVDHSPEAVGTTRRLNRSAIASGRLRVLEGSVDHLPFRDGFFNVATAFETTYFWPDLQAGLIEIRRVLSPGGRLVITNEVADREAAGHWAERLGMNVPDGRSLAALAHEAGFLTADISLHPRHGWLRLLAAR